MVSFEDFKKVEFITAQIKEVKDHPNADRLYVLKVDTGPVNVSSWLGSVGPIQKNRSLAVISPLSLTLSRRSSAAKNRRACSWPLQATTAQSC